MASYIGELQYSDEHGMYVYTNLQTVPAEEIWLPEDEVAKRQGK